MKFLIRLSNHLEFINTISLHSFKYTFKISAPITHKTIKTSMERVRRVNLNELRRMTAPPDVINPRGPLRVLLFVRVNMTKFSQCYKK